MPSTGVNSVPTAKGMSLVNSKKRRQAVVSAVVPVKP